MKIVFATVDADAQQIDVQFSDYPEGTNFVELFVEPSISCREHQADRTVTCASENEFQAVCWLTNVTR